MMYQVNIALTEEEYNALLAEAERDEEVLEKHLRDVLKQHLRRSLPIENPNLH